MKILGRVGTHIFFIFFFWKKSNFMQFEGQNYNFMYFERHFKMHKLYFFQKT